MICIILAAGYATRLYPITENFPKALLEVKGKSILDWLIDNAHSTGAITRYVIVSNHKYAAHFHKWAKNSSYNVTVLDNGTNTNETRLGAVRDLWFAVDELKLSGNLLVMAGDNLLSFSLSKFIRYSKDKRSSCVMRYKEQRVEKLRRGGVILTDEYDRVIDMQEKPENPLSQWLTPPFYIFTEDDAQSVKDAILDGCATDAPGSFIAWLCKYRTVHAMLMQGNRYDIGDLESYKKAQREYEGIVN